MPAKLFTISSIYPAYMLQNPHFFALKMMRELYLPGPDNVDLYNIQPGMEPEMADVLYNIESRVESVSQVINKLPAGIYGPIMQEAMHQMGFYTLSGYQEKNNNTILPPGQARELCRHWAQQSSHVWLAYKALQTAPECIAQTWPALVPANEMGSIAFCLMFHLPHEKCIPLFVFLSETELNHEYKKKHFEQVMEKIFFEIGKNLQPKEREYWLPFVSKYATYLSNADLELLILSTTFNILGSDDFSTAWAFFRVYMTEILLTDYGKVLSPSVYNMVIQRALEEYECMEKFIINEWIDTQTWAVMVCSLVLISETRGIDSTLREKVNGLLDINSFRQ